MSMGMGDTNTLQDTLTSGLSNWSNPIAAVQMVPGAAQLISIPGYRWYASGILLPVAALLLLLLAGGGLAGGGSTGRRRR